MPSKRKRLSPEDRALSKKFVPAKVGYGSPRVVDRPEQLAKPSRSLAAQWEKKLGMPAK